jgi:hypothetical protein
VLFDGVDERTLVKPDRENDLFESPLPRKLPDDFLRDVILKLAIRAKTVNQQTHLNFD